MAAAATDKFRKLSRRWVGQIGSGGVADNTTTTIPLSSATNLATDTGVTIVVDRVDANGTATPSLEETIVGVVSGSNIVNAVRGVEGTAQAHDAGAVVEVLVTADGYNDIIDGILSEHNQDGTHNAINASGVSTFYTHIDVNDASTAIRDTSNNELVKFAKTASAVNEWTVTNQATGQGPIIAPTGGDSTIAGNFTGKSAFNKHYGVFDCGTVGATETVNWRNGDRQKMTLDENLTITFSNAVEGQTLTLYMLQDGSGTNTIAFSDTIVWADNTTPSWTTTADKWNVAVITRIGSEYVGVGNKFA